MDGVKRDGSNPVRMLTLKDGEMFAIGNTVFRVEILKGNGKRVKIRAVRNLGDSSDANGNSKLDNPPQPPR